jgi:diguanylate cyclase (GGDEF)-like protein/PAS domain S-box-containing protein
MKLVKLWNGVFLTLLLIAYVEYSRVSGIPSPIPFLLLYMSVVYSAYVGGLLAGLVSAGMASGFIVYCALVSFGPSSLTGGPAQVTLGVVLHILTAFLIGRTTNLNRRLIWELKQNEITLQEQVSGRTEKLAESEKRFRNLIEGSIQGIFIHRNRAPIFANQACADILGYDSLEELLAAGTYETHLAPHESERMLGYGKARLSGQSAPSQYEFDGVRKDGSIVRLQNAVRVVDWNGEPAIQNTVVDISERKRAEEALSFQATHDPLTGLINRSDFEQRLTRVLETARMSRDEHALCYLDLDQFKVINDTCGHMAGDELLRQLGQSLSVFVRKRDTLARLGGDEFGVLMEHCTLEQAHRVADELRKTVEEFRFVWEKQVFHIGVSIGLVPISETSESVAGLLSAADSACYAAKDEGRNRVHIYHTDDTELARRQGEMQWVARINQALEEDRFELWSQPIVATQGGPDRGEHFELLLRLIDEQGDIIPPGAFLPAAERYGISTKLDRWVVGAAFSWFARNSKLLERLHLCCINLSGTSLADEEFLAFVQGQLEHFQIPPQKICFEVTETAAISNLSRAMIFMGTLQQQGCRFALDDFGSGLSSFAYLKTLPVDFLKIDGTFVRDIMDDEVDLALVRSITDVGKVMGKKMIAEFVENEAILQKLREMGVNYAQGYGVGYPTPIEETT